MKTQVGIFPKRYNCVCLVCHVMKHYRISTKCIPTPVRWGGSYR